MANVVQFVSIPERDAGANLAEFIRLARQDLTAFGNGGAWDSDKWRHNDTIVVFATKTQRLTPYVFTPMAEPFKQFAKAYVRYQYSLRPTKDLAKMMQALRCLEAALLDVCGCADVRLANAVVMDVSASKCREFYNNLDIQCDTGRKLNSLFDFLREKSLVPSLPVWKSPFRKPVILTEDLGVAGQDHRARKLPSNEAMLAVADLFAQADDLETQYFSSILILLMVAPSRISEVLSLPIDCIQWESDEFGVPQMYLCWRAAKGKGAMKKWITPAMHEVVHEAVRRLRQIGAPAREAARFAYENPSQFMPHRGCVADPLVEPERPLLPGEFCAALNLRLPGEGRLLDGSPTWARVTSSKWVRTLIDEGKTSYRHLALHVLATYGGHHWPYVGADKTVKSWDALCLLRENELNKKTCARAFSWRVPFTTEVNSRISPSHGRSLFERKGLRDRDGSSIKLTTHQLRHWLSTMSERAGMDDHTLAQWAGRAKAADNRHYDHRTSEEQLEVARQLLQVESPPLLDRFKHRQAVTYQELGVDRLGTAKATLYGMCVHDYAMAPCQKQRECMTCKEHVCVKGDHVTLDRIRLLEAQTENLLEQAQRAHAEGDFGADRWVDNHKWKLAHVRAMRMALEHQDVAEGAILRIPDGHDPSPVRRALMDLGLEGAPKVDALTLKVIARTTD